MLVLTRKIQEAVIVGKNQHPHRLLTVTVLAIHGDRVKLGFEGDDAVQVQRLEVWQRIQAGSHPAGGLEHQLSAVPTLRIADGPKEGWGDES